VDTILAVAAEPFKVSWPDAYFVPVTPALFLHGKMSVDRG
jgi:hypothetical protein